MKPSIEAFSDELLKIGSEAVATQRAPSPVSKERVRAAVKAIIPSTLAFGLGGGLGGLAGRSFQKRVMPGLTPQQASAVGAILGGGIGLSMDAVRSRFRHIIDEADKKTEVTQ